MVYRAYVEKKSGLDNEARALKNELVSLLGIKGLEKVRVLNRYDIENIEKDLFDYSKGTVLSEPQLDIITEEPNLECDVLFAVEPLPGQFVQSAFRLSQRASVPLLKPQRFTAFTAISVLTTLHRLKSM